MVVVCTHESEIKAVEEFSVQFTYPQSEKRLTHNMHGLLAYEYGKAAAGNTTVSSWLRGRLKLNYSKYLGREIIGDGTTVAEGQTRLKNVRDSYRLLLVHRSTLIKFPKVVTENIGFRAV